jgi:hypothetical protein
MALLNIFGPTAANLLSSRMNPGMMANAAPRESIRFPGDASTNPLGPSQQNMMLSDSTPKENILDLGFDSAFDKIFLEPIKSVPDAPAEDVAEKIYMMLAYASTIQEDQIHPIVKEFVIATKNNDQAGAISGFNALCAYLGINDAKAAQIGVLIYEMDSLGRSKLEDYEKKLNIKDQDLKPDEIQSAMA